MANGDYIPKVVRYETRGGKYSIMMFPEDDTWSVKEYTYGVQTSASVGHPDRESAEKKLQSVIQTYAEIDGIHFHRKD